ncbi:MAG: nuclear transport factor 2 family protein [Pseudomonadota bacterium]
MNYDFIFELEKKEYDPVYCQTDEFLNSVLHPDFFEIIPSGIKYAREDVIDLLVNKMPPRKTTFSVPKIEQLAGDIVLITYDMKVEIENEPPKYTYRASIWRQVGEQWLHYYHQATIRTQAT